MSSGGSVRGAIEPRDAVLSAIRVLRSRRVRPSDTKIAWLARREFLQSEAVTATALQELVRRGDAFRVIYKGGTSYRVAPHKAAAAARLAASRPAATRGAKPHKMTPTPTDILRPLLTAVAKCEPGEATKERIAEELRVDGHDHLVGRLDTLLQKELRVGLIGRRVSSAARASPTYYVTRSAPLALISHRGQNPLKGLPSPIEVIPPPVSPTGSPSKAPAPFEHLQLHLKRLQQQKDGVLENELSPEPQGANEHFELARTLSPSPLPKVPSVEALPAEPLSETPPMEVDTPPEGQKQQQPQTSRRGRPRKVVANSDGAAVPAATVRRGRPPKTAANSVNATRPTRHTKRARKVFDPSDSSARRRPTTISASSVPEAVPSSSLPRCDVCGQATSTQAAFEELLMCHRCSARAHPTCLGYSTELAVRSRLGPWTCMDCKQCAVCDMDHNVGTLIFCDECDRAYHLSCHQPPLNDHPTSPGAWVCFACVRPDTQSPNVYESVSGLPTPRDSPVPDDDDGSGGAASWTASAGEAEAGVPSAATWSVHDVIEYFEELGFKEQATIFSDQDIDGTALLMLTRTDVLTGLGLRLGPALKIYKQVRILQTRLPNPPLP